MIDFGIYEIRWIEITASEKGQILVGAIKPRYYCFYRIS